MPWVAHCFHYIIAHFHIAGTKLSPLLMPSCKDYQHALSLHPGLFFVFFSPTCMSGLAFNEHDTCLVQATSFSNEHLQHECVLPLGHAIGTLNIPQYTSHLQLYLSFCNFTTAHQPTVDTLSFLCGSFMCHHINPC